MRVRHISCVESDRYIDRLAQTQLDESAFDWLISGEDTTVLKPDEI
jgi:hypothetical protein